MRVKICGITNLNQALTIADLGADSLGFICVKSSPRYIEHQKIKEIIQSLNPQVKKIGVFVNISEKQIQELVEETRLTGVQLHGSESPEFCRNLRQLLPSVELIKAIRVKNQASLLESKHYFNCVDTLLLDTYDPKMHGGTGKTLNWEILTTFNIPIPWLLAGGLTPENIIIALEKVKPDGIDLSSGVEKSPGDKDLSKVAQLFANLKNYSIFSSSGKE